MICVHNISKLLEHETDGIPDSTSIISTMEILFSTHICLAWWQHFAMREVTTP